MTSEARNEVDSGALLAFEPSHADLYNACMSYRHDFGLLSFDEQARVRDQALYWLRAWGHTLPQFKANIAVSGGSTVTGETYTGRAGSQPEPKGD